LEPNLDKEVTLDLVILDNLEHLELTHQDKEVTLVKVILDNNHLKRTRIRTRKTKKTKTRKMDRKNKKKHLKNNKNNKKKLLGKHFLTKSIKIVVELSMNVNSVTSGSSPDNKDSD
jgi:hypothetical protein